MWMGELKGYPRAWSNAQILQLSNLLVRCNETRPSEIHRSIRALKQLKHWKGTEFRTVLLYTGIVVFKDHLSANEYDLFLRLFCAVTICSANMYKDYLPIARNLLIEFNEIHINIYEEHSITNNIHLLSHLVDDVEHLGNLTTIGSYPFENALHHIKMRLKQCNRPLEQISRRISELSACNLNFRWDYIEKFPKVSHEISSIDHPGSSMFQHIEFKSNVVFSSLKENRKDRWILTKNNAIIEFDFVILTGSSYMIQGRSLKNTEDFFQLPFRSRYVNIFSSDGDQNGPALFPLNDIKAKLFCLSYREKFVFIPLLHSL